MISRIQTMPQSPRLLPVRCFLVVLVAAVTLYLLLGILLWAANRRAHELRDHALALDNTMGEIRLETEILASQSLLAAATGELIFVAHQEQHRARLSTALAQLRHHATQYGHVPGHARLQDLIEHIATVQLRAMALVGDTEREQAWKLLRGQEYEWAGRQLTEILDTLDTAIEAWTAETLAVQERYTTTALWCVGGFTPVFLLVSLVLLRSAARNIRANQAAQAALAENAQTLEALLNATTDRVFLTDREGRILAINPAGARGLGLPPAAILGRGFRDIFPAQVATGRLNLLNVVLATGEALRFTDARDGFVFDHSMTPLPDVAGHPRGVALFSRDITDIVRDKEAAEAANRAKSAFLASISHEIRTPLNGIFGMAQILVGPHPTEEQRLCLEDIQTASEGLLTLVGNILELSRLEAGLDAVETNDFALSSVIQSLTLSHGPQAQAKGLTLTVQPNADVPPLLRGDGDRLRRILGHLLDNAVKFTPTGAIGVTVERRREAGRHEHDRNGVPLVFAVHDTGIGIEAKDHTRIFESFSQADGSATRRFGGTGLGLAIANRLVESLGGVIQVDSAPGQGSTFSFLLRFDEPGPETTGEA